MISKTAQADIEELWEEGFHPTVADIVQLNALGLLVECQSHPTEAMYYLRRCAWLDEIVLKQPLLAHEIWLGEANRCVSDDTISQLAINAFICCVEPENLPDSSDPKAISEAIKAFVPSLSKFTHDQIACAVMYVTCGNDWRYGEEAPQNPNKLDNTYAHLGPEFSLPIGIVLNGIAIGIGLTMKEAINLPRHTYEAMVERRVRYDGAVDKKKLKSNLEDDYLRAYDEIKARLKGKEVNNNG